MHQEEGIALVVLRFSASIVIVIMLSLLGYLGFEASGLFSLDHISLVEFLTGTNFDPDNHAVGAAPFILGSLAVTFLALLLGGPLGIAVAIFISEIAPPYVARGFSLFIELLVGIPSVVYGWIGLMVIVPQIRVLSHTSGFGMLSAALVLAVMILPTIVALSVEALRAEPMSLREGSLALGATRWETIRHALLPAARAGLGVAMILGIARGIGETLAVQMVIGNASIFPHDLFHAAAALPTEIVIDMAGAPPGSLLQHALFTMAFVLLMISMLLVLLVRFLARNRAS